MSFLANKNTQLAAIAGIAFAVLALGACSGGGGSIANPVPQPNQPSTPEGATTQQALSAAGMIMTLPGVAGFGESLTIPTNNATAGTDLTVRVTSSAPAVMPRLAPDMHVAIPFLYFTIGTNKDVTLNGFPGFKMTIPAGFDMGNLPVKVGYYDPISGWKHVGDFTMVGHTVTFNPTSTHVTLKAGVAYYAITYTCGGPSPSPVPSPTCTTVPLAVGTPLPIPALGGFSGDWVAGENDAPAGTTVTVTTYLTPPSGAPSPVADTRNPLFVRPPVKRLFVTTKYSSSSKKASSSSTSTITFAKFPAVEFDLPLSLSTSGLTFKLETFDLTTGALLDTETGTLTGSPAAVSFPGTNSPFTALAGHTYLWELITESVGLYVTNLSKPTFITVYDQNGNQLTPSGTFPNLRGASRIAFNSSNSNLYVTSFINSAVTEYDQNGNQITPSGTFPNLNAPLGIAYDSSSGHLYVINIGLDTTGPYTITIYDQNGNQITPSGTFPNLNAPFGIAFDSSNDHLYVINNGNNTITEYDQNGNQITPSGTFPNLNTPEGIAFDSSNDQLYVTNFGSGGASPSTITIYDQNGNQITPSGTFPNLHGPAGIAFDSSNDHLYVTNVGNNTVTEYDQNGNQITPSGTFPNLHHPDSLVVVP